jgi:CHAT domain-containing protein/tetratricopeptide (TPR) repeat protein
MLFVQSCNNKSDQVVPGVIYMYSQTLNELALSCIEEMQPKKGLEYSMKSVEILEKLHDCDQEVYCKALSMLATCYSVNGYYKEALRIGKQQYSLLARIKGQDCWQSAFAALQLSNYYSSLGYYEEKEKWLHKVIEISRRDTTNFGPPILSTALNNLSMYYLNVDLEKAFNYEYEAYLIRKRTLGENSLLTIQSLYNAGICLHNIAFQKHDMKMAEDALSFIFDAIANSKTIMSEGDWRYAKMKEIVTDLMTTARCYEEAIKNEGEISVIYKSSFGVNDVRYLHSQERLAKLYFLINDDGKATECINQVMDGYEDYIAYNFSVMTAVERAKLVTGLEPFFDNILPAIVYYKNTPEMNEQLFNAQLQRKGMLLCADMELNQIIKESQDSLLIQMNSELMKEKSLLHRQSLIPFNRRNVNIDTLKYRIAAIEDKLMAISTSYRKYVHKRNAKWIDIQNAIGEKDLVVEFVSFMDTSNAPKEHYVALTFNKRSAYPELIHLFTADQFPNNYSADMFRFVWKPIIDKHKNIDNIYFSPTGMLNNVGIEYFLKSVTNVEPYHLYRLSSTRELLNKRVLKPYHNAVLYGGLSYDEVILPQKKPKDSFLSSLNVMYRGLADSLISRAGFEPLPNTLTEVSSIKTILTSNKIHTMLLTDKAGTEDSFKELSDKDIDVMHMATHGSYINPDEAVIKRSQNDYRFIQFDEGDNIQEDAPLTRSFLVMSGGNMLSHNVSIPEMMEDGILTALEISSLDFYGLDLVVLSACQTALGDVKKEGVYGLQRAFKKAGANTILMSLDKVDDEATQILMVEFYRNLMAGKSKYQSLKDAQRHLRQVENGKYDKPEYWASFIMLDGLN